MKKLVVNVIALAALLPTVTSAHPGHGHDAPSTPGHYIFNPEHSIPILLAIATLVLIAVWQRRSATNKK